MIEKEIKDLIYNLDKDIDLVLFSHRRVAIWYHKTMTRKRAYEIMNIIVREYYRRECFFKELHWNHSTRVLYYQFGEINPDLVSDMEIAFIKERI